MARNRREFTRKQREQIVERSKNERGEICCEGCNQVLAGKPHEIDHTIPEGLRPDADKAKPITIAEGRLLGVKCCHRGQDGKTAKDIAQIAKAKRQYDRANGMKTKAKPKIPSRQKAPARAPKYGLQPLGPKILFAPKEAPHAE